MGANPHANGGLLLRDLKMPDFREYAVDVPKPGQVAEESTRVMGRFLRDIMKYGQDMPQIRDWTWKWNDKPVQTFKR